MNSYFMLVPKLGSHFAQYAEAVELGDFDMEREFNDMRFVCMAYLQLLEKTASGGVYNILQGKSVLDLLGQSTNHHLYVMVNPAFMRNSWIHFLGGSLEKLCGIVGDFSLPALQDTFRWTLGAASGSGLNT